jgi:hypothetical protein
MVLACILTGFLAFIVALAAVNTLRARGRVRRARRTTRELIISPLSGLVLGAVLIGFQAILQPENRHRVVEEQKEESPDDQSGDEPPGGRLFVQQLQQIRKGAEVKELVVRLNPGSDAGKRTRTTKRRP